MKVGKTYLLVNKPTYLHAAIERYLRYVLETNVEILNPKKLQLQDNSILFFLDINIEDTLKTYAALFSGNIAPEKARTIGIKNHSDINILDLNNLKTNFERSFYSFNASQRNNNPFIADKLSTFFKGHGEQSLLGCMGWVTYYFENYARLLNSKDYSPQGVCNHFLLPGIKHWNEFERRFEKHAAVIYIAGWNKETKRIESLINIVSSRLDSLIALKKTSTFDDEILNAISEIRAILEDIEQQIHSRHGETPPADHR